MQTLNIETLMRGVLTGAPKRPRREKRHTPQCTHRSMCIPPLTLLVRSKYMTLTYVNMIGNDSHHFLFCLFSSPLSSLFALFQCSLYTDKPPSQEFPAAAYGPQDFHCEQPLNSWTDPVQLNAGWLSGLVDLNTEREYGG